MARLVVEDGGATRGVALDRAVVRGGRAAESEVVLSDAGVSSHHFELRREPDGGYRLVDLESRNGTRLNGAFVNQAILRDGDVIQAGGARMVFQSAAGAPVPAAAAAPRAARVAPARSGAPAPARATAARPRRARAEADPDPGAEEARPRRSARSRRAPSGPLVALLLVGVVAVVGGIGWLVVREDVSHNRAVRLEMLEAERRLEWQRMADLAKTADRFGDAEEYAAVQELAKRAEEALAGAARGRRVDESKTAYHRALTWHRENKSDVPGYVERLDAFLAEYGEVGGPAVQLAKAERVKFTGTATPGEPRTADEAWTRTQEDVGILLAAGEYARATGRLAEFEERWASLLPGGGNHVRDLRKEIAEGASKWFGGQVFVAARQAERGELNRAEQTLDEAARKVGLPEFEQRAAEEKRRILGR